MQCPDRYHGVTWGLVANVPEALTNWYLLHFHVSLRARYLKKLEREAAKKKAT